MKPLSAIGKYNVTAGKDANKELRQDIKINYLRFQRIIWLGPLQGILKPILGDGNKAKSGPSKMELW